MAENTAVWTGTNAWWNAVSTATSEGVVQTVIYSGGKPFGNPATNIAAFHDFLSNVAQAVIDYNKDPNPDNLAKIERQAVQILAQMGLAEIASAVLADAAIAVGATTVSPAVAVAAVIGAVAGAVLASIYGDKFADGYQDKLKPLLFDIWNNLEDSRFPDPPPNSIDTRRHNYPDPRNPDPNNPDPVNNWREGLRPPRKPNDPKRPAPKNPNTYRIVWIGDPLALDMDGDGIETVSTTAGVFFDHDADGIKTNTGWVKADDGLLVRDINGNGVIDTGRELFGDNTRLANGSNAADGFAALRDLDSNADGKIDTTDTAFNELKIWRDLNQDGISQIDELTSLTDAGVTSFDLNAIVRNIDQNGNTITTDSSFSKTDGSTATLANLSLTQDTFYSEYVNHVEIPVALLDLPDVAGMGRLRSLREAAALSPALATVLAQYAAAETRAEQKTLIDQLLLEWAKTDPSYTEAPVKVISFYSDLTYDESSENVIYLRRGQTLPQRTQVSMLNPLADTQLQHRVRIVDAVLGDRVTTMLNDLSASESANVNRRYDSLANAVYADLLTGTRFQKYLDSICLTITDTGISLDVSTVIQLFRDRIASDPVNGMIDLLEFNTYANDLLIGTSWDGLTLLGDVLRNQTVTPELQALYQEFNVRFNGTNGAADDDIILGDEQKRTINGGEGNNIFLGGVADETLVSGSGNDIIRGGDGNDIIRAGLGDDIINGGQGDDILYGSEGNTFYNLTTDSDTYLFGLGDGHDTIYNKNYDMANRDAIRFKEGITANDIRFERGAESSEDLIIVLGDGSDSITVTNWFASPFYQIARLEFSDGTALDLASVAAHLVKTGTSGNDVITGSESGEIIEGFGGNDILYGDNGEDRLDGGAGNDTLAGGFGNDTYLFGRGSGQDAIYEKFGSRYDGDDSSNDAIEFGADVLPGDIIVRRMGNDMMLAIKGTDDQLTITDGFNDYSDGNRIEQLRFADGTAWNYAALQALALQGTGGDDILEGGAVNDLLDGGAGNDILRGKDGTDTYRFGRGYGNDVIEDTGWAGVDMVEFMTGITPAELSYSIDANGALLISVNESTDSLLIKNVSSSIERYRFSDGTTLTLADIRQLAATNSGAENIVGTPDDDTLLGHDIDSTILGLEGNDTLSGAGGNDVLGGGDGNDTLAGNAGDDSLYGGADDDIIDGGSGRDYIEAGTGANVIRFEQGCGVDYVRARLADGQADTIEFGAGITPTDLQVQLGGQRSWNIRPGDTGYGTLVVGTGDDAIRIEIDAWSTDLSRISVRKFRFSDGTELTLGQIIAMNDGGIAGWQSGDGVLVGSNADDSIYGSGSNDAIRGRAGNDTLSGDDGCDLLDGGSGDDYLWGDMSNDVLAGGRGDDTLVGYSGEDTYLFNRGDGNDSVDDNRDGGRKTISFGVGIAPVDVSAMVDDYGNLRLLVDGGTGGSLTLQRWFFDDRFTMQEPVTVEHVQFVAADGAVTTYDLAGLVRAITPQLSSATSAAPLALFVDAASYDITLAAMPGGGDAAIAYAQSGDLFGTANYADSSVPVDGDNRLTGTEWDDSLESGAGNDLLYGLEGDDYLAGGSGHDRIDGGAGDDEIYGGSGDDLIMGGDGDDYIQAGQGNDTVYGGIGDDTIVFNAGDGLLTIEQDYNDAGYYDDSDQWVYEDTSGYNTLSFGAGITFADLRFSEQDGYLIIDIPSTGDQLRLAGYNPDHSTLSNVIDSYLFADGSVATAQDLQDAGLTVAGSGGDDHFNGTTGNDIVKGGAGNDEFATGQGSDWLLGGGGNDTYFFNPGDGLDTIVDISDPGMENRVNFGYGIYPESIRTEVVDGSLILWVGDGGDGIRFEGFDPTVPGMPQPVGNFDFWDGTSISLADLLDSQFGGEYQEGGSGSNTYVFNQGDGVVSIFDFPEEGAVNTLKFGPGIAPEDLLRHLRFESPDDSDSGRGTFIIAFDNGDQVRMDGFTPDDVENSQRSIDTFVFDDGTILSFAEAVRSIFVVEGYSNDDLLTGTNLNDRLYGYEGSDSLESGAGDDALTGGTGNDRLNGGSERDTYICNLGDGIDTVIDAARNGIGNIVSFGPGITRDDLIFTQDGTILTINYGGGGDAIIVENFDPTGVNGTLVIDTFEFSDGSVLSYRELTNHAPVAADPLTARSAIQDQSFVFQIPETAFSDADGDQLTYHVSVSGYDSPPEWLHFDPATRTLSGTPGNDHVGTFTVEVSAIDPLETTAGQSFTLTVENVNDAPIVVTPLTAQSVTQDHAFTFQVPVDTFTDIDKGDQLAYSATLANGDPLPGWLQFDAITGTFSGIPGNNNVGAVSIQVTATDMAGASTQSSFAIDVANVNDAPVVAFALADQAATEDQAFSFQIPADSFKDIDTGDTLTYSATLADGSSLPGWLIFDAATQTFSGIPGNDNVGAVSIQVTATDMAGASTTSSFAIDVANVNDAPVVASALADQTASEDQAFSFQIPAGSFNDIDAGDMLTYSATLADGSSLPGWLTFDAAAQTFSGIPGNGNVGAVNVTVTATDLAGAATTSSFAIDVANVNDAPVVASALADQAATEDKAFTFQIPADSFKDIDTGDTLTYSVTLADGSSLPGWLIFDVATQTFSGTPGNDSVGAVSVQVTATDLAGATTNSSFTIDVTNVNDAPDVASALVDHAAMEDQTFSFQIPADSFKDIDAGDTLTYSAALADGSSLPGWLTFDAATQTFSGTPGNDNVGAVSIQVTATDMAGASTQSSFAIDVANVNDAPVVASALADQAATEDQAFSFQIPADSFMDIDTGDTLTYSATLADGSSLPGWLVFDAANQTFSGTPGNDNVGAVSVQVTATDLAGATTNSSFTIDVTNVNDAPVVASALADQAATEDQAFSFQIPADSFKDIDAGDTLTYSAALADGSSLPGWLQFDASTGTFSGIPGNDNVGSVSIQVTASDMAGASTTSSFAIDVANVNDAPVATTAISDQTTTAGAAFTLQVPANTFTDVDAGDSLTLGATLSGGNPLPAWLVFDPITQTFSGTPPGAATGNIGVQLTASDLSGATANSGFTITVTGGNSAPVAIRDSASLIEDQRIRVSGNLLANDFDPDPGTILTVSSPGVQQGIYGSLEIGADGTYGYRLDNRSIRVQSLGRDDIVTEQFDYSVSDGSVSATSTLDISVSGTNDAPIVVKHLADRGVTFNKSFSFKLPETSFSDSDKGDLLTLSATLASGAALPDWLKFDAATGTFSGKTPKSVGELEIRVTAIDAVAATGNTKGSLSVSDTFSLSVVKGEAWVREAVEQPTPHDDCHDGKHDRQDDAHLPGKNESRDDQDVYGKGSEHDCKNDDHKRNQETEQLHTSSTPYVSSEELDRHLKQFDHTTVSRDDQSIAARWQAIDRAIFLDLANVDDSYQHLKQGIGLSHPGFNGAESKAGAGYGMDSMALAAGSGTNLKGFSGLKEGMHSL